MSQTYNWCSFSVSCFDNPARIPNPGRIDLGQKKSLSNIRKAFVFSTCINFLSRAPSEHFYALTHTHAHVNQAGDTFNVQWFHFGILYFYKFP
ncbi:MAG: hypothetical protein DWQ05_09200 [Calditrichaeota bacterium]|nr:MAG: hypothetical protein DWQ05_09200 [Calditrichota bacterium]